MISLRDEDGSMRSSCSAAQSCLMRTLVTRLEMQNPGDVSSLARLLDSGALKAGEIKAIIGKTEGNGGVNDFTRGYFTQSLMALLARHTGLAADALVRQIPCILSGGTEGVLSPHYVVFSRTQADAPVAGSRKALAVGTAMSAPMAPEDIGRRAHVDSVAGAVRAAIKDAGINSPHDVHFVQVKCPCVTAGRAAAAMAMGKSVVSTDPNRSMAEARIAGAFGVAAALGEIDAGDFAAAYADRAPKYFSTRASVSSGIEVEVNEVIVLANSAAWTGPLEIAHQPMRDALDIGGIVQALAALGIDAAPQVPAAGRELVRAVFVKCEPDRSGAIRGLRHTMLDDTDINAQRHIRGAVGGLVAGVIGDTRIFVSGGAEHQGPDGGGLIAIIAERIVAQGGRPCAS